jgi:hypothetical protein
MRAQDLAYSRVVFAASISVRRFSIASTGEEPGAVLSVSLRLRAIVTENLLAEVVLGMTSISYARHGLLPAVVRHAV